MCFFMLLPSSSFPFFLWFLVLLLFSTCAKLQRLVLWSHRYHILPIPTKILHDQGLGCFATEPSDGSRPPWTVVTCSYRRATLGRYIKSTVPGNSAAEAMLCNFLSSWGHNEGIDWRGKGMMTSRGIKAMFWRLPMQAWCTAKSLIDAMHTSPPHVR